MNKNIYYNAFNFLSVRPLVKCKIFEYFNYDVEKAFNVTEAQLAEIAEFYDITIQKNYIEKRDKINLDKCYEKAFADENIKLLTYEDEKYPPLLKEIPDFPLALYYKGNLENIDNNFNLAVVGSRNATTESKIALENIISNFKDTDLTIVSGLAYGIDATSHSAAIKNNLKTVGVIGCGLDIIYPYQNKKIYEQIIDGAGVIFSEYPLKTQPISYNFPQRNRIVVGMSKGTLVAEARLKSGAMISANLTLDYNRELMCIPGNLLNPNTEGIYHLIKQGAGMVIEAADILNYMSWEFETKEDIPVDLEINDEQKKVYDIVSCEAKNFDEILADVEFDTTKLMVLLTELELKGLIVQSNNKYYRNQ